MADVRHTTRGNQEIVIKNWDTEEGLFNNLNPVNLDPIGNLDTGTIRELLTATARIIDHLCHSEFLVPECLYKPCIRYLRMVYKLLVFRWDKLQELREAQIKVNAEYDGALSRAMDSTEFEELEQLMDTLDVWRYIKTPKGTDPEADLLNAIKDQSGEHPASVEFLFHSGLLDPTIEFQDDGKIL